MKFLNSLVTAILVANTATCSNWISTAAYNKWHQSELERWLSDNEIPYPTAADRKELQQIVADNWDAHAVAPYKSWDTTRLTDYLKSKGAESKDVAEASKDSLLSKAKSSWFESEDDAQKSWGSIKDWILDTWTESQLKAFCDHHGIPVPQPRQRDTFLQKARSNYEAVARKADEYAAYPGDWLYESWSESDLKKWCDEHGYTVPQPSPRDKLVAAVRRNSYEAALKLKDQSARILSSAKDIPSRISDEAFNSWSESELKQFCDEHGIKVPQGSKENQLRALVRKNYAKLTGDSLSDSAASVLGAATSNIAQKYAQATQGAAASAQDTFDQIVNTWSESRLKGFLDARGIPTPQGTKKEELQAMARKNAHKATSGWNAWTFDDFSVENLRNYLSSAGTSVSDSAESSRNELLEAAQAALSSASAAGGSNYAAATNYLTQATEAAKKNAFDSWSESDLKSYLDSYGVSVPQGSTLNELKAQARKQYTYFRYGTTTPSGTIMAKLSENVRGKWQWIKDQLNLGADAASQKAQEVEMKAKQEL